MKNEGFLYVVHFTPKFKHAGHYTGFAKSKLHVRIRFEQHRKGHGARIIQAAADYGCTFKVFIVKRGTRHDERRLKNAAHPERYCPICKKKV